MGRDDYHIVVERTKRGKYCAYVPDLPGCVVAGRPNREAALAAMRDGIAFHIEGLQEDGLPIPKPSRRLGKRIRALRKMRGITQSVAARKIGRSQGWWGDLEGGRTTPRFDTLLRLAKSLDCDTTDLVAGVKA
jgi:predicted RNase H-like HicB family nuclease/DNA-binding Xre family transcriptional regulator